MNSGGGRLVGTVAVLGVSVFNSLKLRWPRFRWGHKGAPICFTMFRVALQGFAP